MRWLTTLIFLVLSFAAFNAKSDPLVLNAQLTKLDLASHLTFLRDPSGSLTLDDVALPPLSNVFSSKDGALNFGITSDAIWLRLEVRRAPSTPAEWWLEISPVNIEEASLYQLNADSNRNSSEGNSAGIMIPLSSRKFKAQPNTFKITLNNSESQIIYLRLRSSGQINVRAYLWQPAFYAEKSASENLFLGIYYGAFALIVCLSGLRWRMKRNPVDLWWLVYLVAEGFVVFRMNGLASRYFFPELPPLNAMASTISLSVMVWAGARFGIHAFALDKQRCKYSYHAAVWIGGLSLLIGFVRLIGLEPASSISMFLVSLLLCLLNCACSYRFLKSGEPSAKFYFSGIWFMTVCVFVVLARNFGFIPAYHFIDYVWQSNLILHAGLVSFGMVLAQKETTHERRRAADYKSDAEANLKYSALQKRMVTLVSHEFRNSLAMLNISMHAIKKSKGLPSEVTERHRNIVRIHHQMRTVIDNFLLEARIQNSDIKISYCRTDMISLIHEVISLAELHGKEQLISVEAPDLPKYLWLDDGILRLILTNLLDNVVKYSDFRSCITLRGLYLDGVLRMSVSDNGIGMSEDSLARLFEPHFKADLRSDGIGIGLYMVRMMLHAHDGDMRVVSAIGKGSTIEFWMNVKTADEMPANQYDRRRLSQ